MADHCGLSCSTDVVFYRYKPNIGGNAAFLAISVTFLLVIFFLGFRYRILTLSLTLGAGLILNVLGFLGRILLHNAPDRQGYFALCTVGLLLGPTCTLVGLVLILPHILTIYGERFSPWRPFLASLVLHSLAVVSLVIELVGSLFLVYGFGGVTQGQSCRIILAGLAVQILTLLAVAFLYMRLSLRIRFSHDSLDLKHSNVYETSSFRRFRTSFVLALLLLASYSVYRVVEMAMGVDGVLFQHEAAFLATSGLLPLLSNLLMILFHPGPAFGAAWTSTSSHHKKRRAPPPPLRHPAGYNAHHCYDPTIRQQFSPGSERSGRRSNPPEQPAGSPGLPASPRPAKASSSLIPSPRSFVTTSSTRLSTKQDRRSQPRPDMVDSNDLW